MRAFWVFIIIIAGCIGWFGGTNPSNTSGTLIDISWPNCGVAIQKADSGIVGITGGLSLWPNKCLTREASLFKKPSVYVNTGYPGIVRASKYQNFPKSCSLSDEQCLAYNYGYISGRYDIDYSLRSGVLAKNWWLDVETENSWSDDIEINRASLRGTLDSISEIVGKTNVGFYSYPGQWDLITGKWRNGYPAWVATGSKLREAALEVCGLSHIAKGFTGGPIIYAQYTEGLDQNLVCSLNQPSFD